MPSFSLFSDQPSEILPDTLVTDAGHLAVKRPVEDFEVAHPLVHQREQPLHALPFGQQIALDGRRDPRLPAQCEKLGHELRLQQRLTARNRHAAARLPEERQVARHAPQRFARLNALPDQRQRTRRTRPDAVAADRTVPAVNPDTLRRQAKGRRGARFQTRAAPDAPSRRLLQLHAAAPRLRVVTPAAAHAAPFQEEGRTDARTVVHGHPLNGRDRPFHYFPRPKTKLER